MFWFFYFCEFLERRKFVFYFTVFFVVFGVYSWWGCGGMVLWMDGVYGWRDGRINRWLDIMLMVRWYILVCLYWLLKFFYWLVKVIVFSLLNVLFFIILDLLDIFKI